MKRLIILQMLVLGILFSAYGMSPDPLSEGQGKIALMNHERLQLLELALIEEYLKENRQEPIPGSTFVRIYNTKGELVFEGDSEKEEARGFLLSADLLTELSGLSLYLKD